MLLAKLVDKAKHDVKVSDSELFRLKSYGKGISDARAPPSTANGALLWAKGDIEALGEERRNPVPVASEPVGSEVVR